MFMPAVFHENLFDDFFDPFWNDGALERAMNREERETFGKRGANMMKTDVKQTADGNYDGGNLASAGLATLPRDGGAAYYNLALNASGARYTLTAIPTGVMNGDPCGLLTLDQGGQQGVSMASMTAAECW